MTQNADEKKFGNGSAFSCKMCGQCCQGSGGIVMAEKDIMRLADHLGLQRQEFLDTYAELKNGKHRLRVNDEEYCVFFEKGCGVHEAKPDVCRAWPFFKGNIEDAFSLSMAKEYCPGINPDISFRKFAAAGRAFLLENGLIAEEGQDDEQTANALRISSDPAKSGRNP